MSVWGALGFMGLGGAIVLAFCILAWRMYRIGRGERPRSMVKGSEVHNAQQNYARQSV